MPRWVWRVSEQRIRWLSVLTRVAFGVAFAALFLDSIVTTVRWWRGELVAPTVLDWVEIGLLPLLLFVYLRFFSIFRPDCRACEFPENPPHRTPPDA